MRIELAPDGPAPNPYVAANRQQVHDRRRAKMQNRRRGRRRFAVGSLQWDPPI